MLKNVVCMVAGHRIDRHKVRFDGLTFVGKCTRCSCEMARETHGWLPHKPAG